jgi:hypothetical protein
LVCTSHQPARRTSPAAGVNEQNLTSIFDLTPGRYGLGLGWVLTRSLKERALPIRSHLFLLPGGEYSMPVSAFGGLRGQKNSLLTAEKRRYYSKILDPGVLLINPGLAKKVCRHSGIKCLAIGQVNQALELQLVEIAHQVQWNSKRRKVHPGGGATHQLQDIYGITVPLAHSTHALLTHRDS